MPNHPANREIHLLDGRFYAEDPFPHFAWLRAHAPVYFDDASRLWGVSRYADVMQVSRDPETFHSAPTTTISDMPPEIAEWLGSMINMDAPKHTKLWAMVETPYAMLHAEDIAAASDRLTVLVMGTNDLAKELYAEHVPGRQPLLAGLGLALLAARATGKAILDGVYNDVKNEDGFLAECRQGREMGFDGKTLIHPGQIAGANAAFAPSEEAVEDARGILDAWEKRTSGVVTYRGRMVENLHVESARRTLRIHEAILALGS